MDGLQQIFGNPTDEKVIGENSYYNRPMLDLFYKEKINEFIDFSVKYGIPIVSGLALGSTTGGYYFGCQAALNVGTVLGLGGVAYSLSSNNHQDLMFGIFTGIGAHYYKLNPGGALFYLAVQFIYDLLPTRNDNSKNSCGKK